MVIIANN